MRLRCPRAILKFELAGEEMREISIFGQDSYDNMYSMAVVKIGAQVD